MKAKKAKLWLSLLVLALVLVYSLLGNAGSLEPSGAPGPTMKTLDEVEPRIPIRASDLPLTITEPNSYYFVGDIHFTSTTYNAITVDCNNVTIDLMGYSLKGPGTGYTSGIRINECDNVEVRNGTIEKFDYPGIFEGYSSSSNHRILNIRAVSNAYGICLLGYGHLVKDCTASYNNYHGIYVEYGGIMTNNACFSNGDAGIMGDMSCVLEGNNCYDNEGDGISGGIGGTVRHNNCCANGVNGIFASNSSTVIGNTARDNTAYGIYASNFCLVDQNAANNNTGGNLFTGAACALGTNCAP